MLFRPSVAAIVQDKAGRILICERKDFPGTWQFPQGGIEPGESIEEALAREIREELSLAPAAYEIVGIKGPYRYRFPPGLAKKGFRGQSHHYFLLKLRASPAKVNVKTRKAEFRRKRWIRPHEFDFLVAPPMKRAAYRRVLRDFFGLSVKKGHIAAEAP